MPNPIINKRLAKRKVVLAGFDIPYDNMESYVNGALANGLDGGVNGTNPVIVWMTGYTGRPGFTDIWVWDDMESYSNNALVNGLNGGSAGLGSWNSTYIGRLGFTSIQAFDDMETYTDGVSVNGLNGGTNVLGTWNSAYRGF